MQAPLIHLTEEAGATELRALAVGVDGRDEAWLRNLVMTRPVAFPIAELDPAFADPVPICAELRTPSGRIDAFLVNRHGAIVVVECKLWRNPEARREVVAQILDYAKDLASWSYEDMQREVSKALRRPGENALFALVRDRHADVVEADFVDRVSRNLSNGRFLLLIVGDGIRQGTETIAQYLVNHLGLRFTLGLVEVAAFEAPGGGLLIQPRLLARTTMIERSVVRIVERDGSDAADEEGETDAESGQSSDPASGRRFDPIVLEADRQCWREFKRLLKLDDPAQPAPITGFGRARLPIIPGVAWINAYSARSANKIGAGCVFKGEEGLDLYSRLAESLEAIDGELAELSPDAPPEWWRGGDGAWIYVARWHDGRWHQKREQDNLSWLLRAANALVNTFRPRIMGLSSPHR